MSANSKIEWTDHTFNPWIGCTKVSPGCTNCYAETRDQRFAGGKHWGKGAPRQRTSASNWKLPVRWNRRLAQAPLQRRERVFCGSLCDWLDEEVPIEWLADLLALIHATNLDWLLLTKRPENFRERLGDVERWLPEPLEPWYWLFEWLHYGKAPQNVWFGVSVEDQKRADERIPLLLEIPANIRFLSCEPLLGPIDLKIPSSKSQIPNKLSTLNSVSWVIVGGESGPNARACNVEWIRDIVGQCKSANVPVFVKQLGAQPVSDEMSLDADHAPIALHDRKGGDPSEWFEDLRIRQFPTLPIQHDHD